MKLWYLDIPAGIYTTNQFVELTKPIQTYHAVKHMFNRLGVKSIKTKNKLNRNEKLWEWKGARFYHLNE